MKAAPIAVVFGNEAYADHEQVVFCRDVASGLEAIIAVHDTTLGPALGGTRMWPYESEAAALRDALRLSRGMTYKNALANLPLGGGKAVIIGDSRRDKSPELLRAYGRCVDRLCGHYITAEDVGISVPDVVEIGKTTRHVRGIDEGGVGDPSPHTAFGVLKGIEAALRHRRGSAEFGGVTVCVQGLGNVGMALAEMLHEAGARLIVADLREAVVETAKARFGAESIAPDQAHAAACDVYAPCALGAVLNQRSIPELRAGIIAGSANNQLETDADGRRLMERDILYAPDYVANAGGVIAISHEGPDFELEAMRRDVAAIGDTLATVFRRSAEAGLPTSLIADQLAEERLSEARRT